MRPLGFLTREREERLHKLGRDARAAILYMTSLASSGHPGGSMSAIDILLTLYEVLNIDPGNPDDEERDLVVVSNGHISPAVYSTLALNDFFPLEDVIRGYRLTGSIFEGHIEPAVPGVEWASGNLGQGLSAGVGMAAGKRIRGLDSRVVVLMGDGEQQKGQICEARRFAVKYRLHNITAIIDYNGLQIGGGIRDVMPQNIRRNYESDGWHVVEIDGHNTREIDAALRDADGIDAPVMILARTVMGKGVSFMENQAKYHGAPVSMDDLPKALQELGYEDRSGHYKALRESWETESYGRPEPGALPELTIPPVRMYDEKTDCRSAWGNALADLARANGESDCPFAVFDCDLQGSVKTADFEKIAPEHFFQSGIMEHHTAVCSAAVSRMGVIPFWADFGVFGVDEVYNQQRLNDINHTNLKVITTHVGLDVGEDGKTHQCIDYMGLMRNLFHFRSIIPADPNHTSHIIAYIAKEYGNFHVPMGRSKMEPVRRPDGSIFYDADYRFEYGKTDLLREGSDAVLLVTGGFSVRAVEAADSLKKDGISLRVVYVSCPFAVDRQMLLPHLKTGVLISYEDHHRDTGLGAQIALAMSEEPAGARLYRLGVDRYACSGPSSEVIRRMGLDTGSISERIRKWIEQS